MKYWIIVLLGCALVWACDPEEEEDYGADAPLADVSGEWSLVGNGNMQGCRDAEYNADKLTLHEISFRVTQGDDATLSADLPTQNDFTFTGNVMGEKVVFKTRETVEGETIEIEFTGRAKTSGVIRGDFEGDGPYACKSEGRFVVEIDD